MPLPEPYGPCRLHSLGERTLLFAPPRGIAEVKAGVALEFRELGVPAWIYAGVDAPIVVDDTGVLYRYEKAAAPRALWETGAKPADVSPIGLANGHLLIRRLRRGIVGGMLRALSHDRAWQVELVDPGAKRTCWKMSGFVPSPIPTATGAFLVHDAKQHEAISVGFDGEVRWRRRMSEWVAHCFGLVGGQIWLTMDSGQVVSLEETSGELTEYGKLSGARNPAGVVDPRGRLVLVSGGMATLVDLAAGAERLGRAAFERPPGQLIDLVYGDMAVLLDDERVLFVDHKQRIYAASYRESGPATLLWHAPELIRGLAVVDRRIVIQLEGELVWLRPTVS